MQEDSKDDITICKIIYIPIPFIVLSAYFIFAYYYNFYPYSKIDEKIKKDTLLRISFSVFAISLLALLLLIFRKCIKIIPDHIISTLSGTELNETLKNQ